jgi:hypothetical protein
MVNTEKEKKSYNVSKFGEIIYVNELPCFKIGSKGIITIYVCTLKPTTK